MNLLKKMPVLILAMFSWAMVSAQSGIPSNVPMDPDVRYGKLDNGLTYYIMKNGLPEKRGEFYIVVNAGAILETPGQNGLAHFTEHMCFNGTKNFEKKAIINYLQSIGMKFGPEINAYTVTDRTVYTLTKVPLDEPANIDTSLMILYDWGCNVTMEGEEIDLERGVIREEFRTRMSGMARAQMEMQKAIYKGSKYEIHNVIGDTNVINFAPWDTLRAFYKDWYRPDLEAVIVVGDFDVDQMEAKVKAMFSKMPLRKDAKERKYYDVPGHKEPVVSISKDAEAPYNVIQLMYKRPANWDRSEKYYRAQYINQLYALMMNARFSEITQAADPAMTYGGAMYTNLQPKLDAYLGFAVAANDKIPVALETLLIENERVRRYGFLQTELDRAKKEMKSAIEKQYKERTKKKSASIANAIIENYLTSEPIPSDDWEYKFGNKVVEEVTLKEMNDLPKQWITEENIVIAMMGLDSESAVFPSEDDVKKMLKGIRDEKVDPYVDKVANRPLIAKEPTAGTIVEEEKDDDEGTTTWTLSNGVKVVLKATDYKEDQILFGARSLGGWSLYQEKDLVSAKLADGIATTSGIGDFDQIELEKYLSGKNIYVSPYISELEEGFSGSSTVEDFSTMLELVYLYFTNPRFEKNAFDSHIKKEKSMMENKSADPSSVFGDSISTLLSNNHPYFRPMTAASYDMAKLSRVKYIFSERFGDPSGFTFYFVGNVNDPSVKEAILKYLGGLPQVNRTETYKDLQNRIPQESKHLAFKRDMKTPKATVFIAFPGEGKYSFEQRLMLTAVKEYLDIRLIETLREEQGGTYGASVFSNVNHYPEPEYFLGVYFDTDPAKLDTMVAIVYDELRKLQEEGADEKSIKNIVENKLKEHQEKIKENRYWLSMLMLEDYHDDDRLEYDYNKFWSSLTSKQIQKAAKKYFDVDKALQLVMSSTNVERFNK